MNIIERLREKIAEMDKDRFMQEVIYEANWRQICKENETMREALKELANSTYHSVDDYKDRAREALNNK